VSRIKPLYVSYEVDESIAKLLELELFLIEEISHILDLFYEDKGFSIKSILEGVDLYYQNYIDEVE
jgi:hypothetical protein